MKTIVTVKLPDAMAKELDEVVANSTIPRSALVRHGIQWLLSNKNNITLGNLGTVVNENGSNPST